MKTLMKKIIKKNLSAYPTVIVIEDTVKTENSTQYWQIPVINIDRQLLSANILNEK